MQTHDWLYEKQEGNPETEREKKQKEFSREENSAEEREETP